MIDMSEMNCFLILFELLTMDLSDTKLRF